MLILEGLVVTVDIKKDKASGIRAQNFGRERRARVQSLTGLITVTDDEVPSTDAGSLSKI